MKILIVGAGAVGFNLAKQLSKEGHDISVIDKDQNMVDRITEKMDVSAVLGMATSPSILEEAGIKNTDVVLAVTNSDEINIVTCILSYKYNVKTKIARIRNPEFSEKKPFVHQNGFHIDYIINPEMITINSIMNIIGTPGANYVADFKGGDVLLRGFSVPADAPIVGKKLADLEEIEYTDSFLIVAIQRNDEMIIPTGETEIKPNDNIYVVMAKEALPFFLPMVNRRADEVAKVVIYGVNRASLNLAKKLEDRKIGVTIVEPLKEKTEEAASVLDRTIILKGDALDIDILKESSIHMADFFVAVSENEQSNLLAALLAKRLGAKKAIVLTEDPAFVPIINSLGIDVVINPRLITAGSILQHIRRGDTLSVVKFQQSEAEAMELIASEHSKILGKPLKEVHFPKGAIIGAISHNGVMKLPTGDTIINPGESVIVFALPNAIEKVQTLFSNGKV
ncbi:Trk system potassium uptake protein trkA [Candidatus Kuenenia stuttgartiensis]|jgi:trk system potassium uptake protein TrkA|uniref:Trk system potassium uptake protein TrkA n=1 Tax=Kuenenia stuttgartiensis TaxID=174633 RepID=Q1PYW8_KUEST|nr:MULTISPECIES: Trk system potassium transporter TrkA [Kuenenia]MBE7547454.1 Trk system potassium transporter TrkA [Planctomycetia bacterium]MBZ0193409.1 Trk system potassium transporter TrkA [Candidatus Kuenenia stuttgartiensis]MCF6152883.1 Trk system potassium transporter TrkA [Candidatus Kuenenia stuttgartiensis]MCL4728360.1 Trk system potassium transporter TrkA [Candidatus Kuenenia stuttgartiensis]MCZ7624209.1 Trk system potassium transporter TrkA [Candidatus Kuenenia sp.]